MTPQKIRKRPFSSFRQTPDSRIWRDLAPAPESGKISQVTSFWTPVFTGVTTGGTFLGSL